MKEINKFIDTGTVGFSYELIHKNNSMYSNPFKVIWENIVNLFLSPRFISFYWRTGGMALIGLLSFISENLNALSLPPWAVVLLGLAIGEATKAISNLKQGKDLGFSAK